MEPRIKVGISLADNGVQLHIDGVPEDVLPWSYPPNIPCYAVFDLYGQCQKIKLINKSEDTQSTSSGQDFEKADFESCEKERSDTNLTLSLPTTSSNSLSVGAQKLNTPTTPLVSMPCNYKLECEKLRRTLYLPGI